MKNNFISLVALLFSASTLAQSNTNKAKSWMVSNLLTAKQDKSLIPVLKDSVVLASLKTVSASCFVSENTSPERPADKKISEIVNKKITVISITSKDSSNEYNELWIYKDKTNKTVALFNSPNPNFKQVGSWAGELVKNIKDQIDNENGGGGINFPSYVKLKNGSSINVPSDGSWSAWTNAGIQCDPDANCLWGAVNGIKYLVSVRVRQYNLPNFSMPGIFELPNLPYIDAEVRKVFVMCACRN